MNTVTSIAAVALVLASQTGDAGCSYRQACAVTFRGPLVEDGQVTDVAIASCDPTALPEEHYIEAWIEHKEAPGAPWLQVSNKQEAYSWKVPNSEHTGFGPLEVPMSTPCSEGEYRGTAYIEGISAPLTGQPEGEEFSFTIVSTKEETYSVGECVTGVTR